MKESTIERFFIEKCKSMGWLPLKLVSPSMAGLPDRIVLQAGGNIFFVELKASGKKPRPLQVNMQEKLCLLGFRVYTVDSKESALEVIKNEIHTT